MRTADRPALDQLPPTRSRRGPSPRTLAVLAVFIAVSAVGALVKVPSPVGSVGLDSASGFFVAVGFTGWMGAVVAVVGHLLTAGIVGFPLTLPVHLAIAAGMGGCAWLFGWLGRRGNVGLVAGFLAVALLNSFALALVVLPVGGTALYIAAVPSLLVGAVLNLAVATAGFLALRNTRLLG